MGTKTCEHENVGLFSKIDGQWLCLRCLVEDLQEENAYLKAKIAHKTEAFDALLKLYETLRKDHVRDRRAIDDCGAFED